MLGKEPPFVFTPPKSMDGINTTAASGLLIQHNRRLYKLVFFIHLIYRGQLSEYPGLIYPAGSGTKGNSFRLVPWPFDEFLASLVHF